MISKRQEILLGLFVLIGLGVLIFMIIFFRDVVKVGRARYEITAEFKNVYGMSPGTPVRLVGIDIGEIRKVTLAKDGLSAKVVLSIESGRRIRTDSKLSIRPQGILGDYYLEFTGGSPGAGFLPTDGTAVVMGEASSILDEMARDLTKKIGGIGQKASDLIDNMNDILDDNEFRRNVHETAANLKDATQKAPAVLVEIQQAAAGVKKLTGDIQSRLDAYDTRVQTLLSGMDKAVAGLDKLFGSFNETVGSLDEILARFREGKGTIGSLIGKDEIYEKLVQTVDQTNATLSELKELIVYIRKNPSAFLWGR